MIDIPAAQSRFLTLHSINSLTVDHDIHVFFERTLGSTISTMQNKQEVLQTLVKRADGHFIWAATVCRFICTGGPMTRKRLNVVLALSVSAGDTSPQHSLDTLYSSVFRNILWEDYSAEKTEELCKMLSRVLGIIAVAFSPLPVASVATLSNITSVEVLDTLSDLHSLFDVPEGCDEPIRPVHASVRNYLFDKRRCVDACCWHRIWDGCTIGYKVATERHVESVDLR
jgi:hypothetical protein